MPADATVVREWSGAAPFWEKHCDAIRRMFAPVAQALMEDAGIAAGSAVVDVATGPGDPAFTIAAAVGPEGRVVGIDPVAEMVGAARRTAVRQGMGNVRFEVASAEELPFADADFDAVVCRFGIMFCPSPVGAIREMLRVLKPGGQLALAVWHFPECNPFLSIMPGILARYVESAPPVLGAPDTFCFATSGKLHDLVGEAGASGVRERLVRFTLEAPEDFEDLWTLRSEMSEKMRAKLTLLTPDQLAAVKAEAREAHRPFLTKGAMSFPAQVLVVSGRKA